MILKILYKLFRFKPTVAWSVCGILLGTATAIHEYGFFLNWTYIAIALLPVILMQGFIAHAINDIEDEEVDKKTDIKGTNRFKVLISGIASRSDLIYIASAFLGVTSAVVVILYETFGFPILVFYAVALYAAFGYSLPPLKLGWRPYSEWTVVFPVLVTLVVAVNYVAAGTFSWLAFIVGTVFALFNILWFITSRLMDYEPDKNAGKITTAVYLGLDFEISKGQGVFYNYSYQYSAVIGLFLFWYSVFLIIFVNPLFIPSAIFSMYMLHNNIPSYRELKNSGVLSVYRTYGIIISIIHSVVISIIFVLL